MYPAYRLPARLTLPGKGLISAIPMLALLAGSPVAAQWNTQSPSPTFLDVRGTGAPTEEHVFLATDDNSFDDQGALFESVDGGASWIIRDVPFNLYDPLNGIFFLDSQNGWAYGNANYRTTDGGTTWIELPFLGSTYFMQFYTTTFGLATGNFERYVSTDGGSSWNPSPSDMLAYDFTSSTHGLGVSETGIYRTTDGGTSFTQVRSGNATAVTYLTGTNAVAIIDDTFAQSTDGGATWTLGASADGRTRLSSVSSTAILAWGRGGTWPDYDDRVFHSANSGQTWTDLGEIMAAGVRDFSVPTLPNVVAADLAGNMYYSTDAGANWALSFTSPGPVPGYLSSSVPVFASATTGYFGYGQGFVIKSTDGGASWFQISSGTGQSLNDLDRFANGNMIVVGDAGTYLTSTGTSPWIVGDAFTMRNIPAVEVLSATDVVTVDESGLVFTSVDAGETWTAAGPIPGSLTATDLDFTTLLDGWVIGFGFDTGALFHTTDGGDSWTPVPDFMGGYVSIDFEGTNGWAANVGGIFYRSTDSGATWTEGELPEFPNSISTIDFYDGSIGYAVGSYGYAARSNDGGVTWDRLPTPNGDDHFTDLYLIGPNELWLSTNNDVAYYTATGGQNWALLPIGSAGFGNFAAIAASPEGDAWVSGFQGYIEHFDGPPPPPLNRPPEASFEYATVGLTVDFTDTSIDPDGTVVSWAWDFGDGNTSTERHPSHTFDTEDTYIVRLTVTDDDGDEGITGRAIAVQPAPGGVFGDFTEVTPIDPLFVTPQDEDFWVATTASADYDGDDDLDMMVFGFYVVYNESVEERLVLLRNDGPASPTEWEFSYIDVDLAGLTSGSSDMAWGDVDGDGDEDLVVGSDAQTIIYRNDGGALVATDTALPGYYEDNDQADFDLRSITWADYDNDSDLDLLLPSVVDFDTFEERTALMRNDGPNGSGGWIFTEIEDVFAPTGHAQSAWADFDEDEDLDLLLIHLAPLTDDGFIRRYRNDGDGTFVGEDILGALTVEHGEAQWGDYDDDGDYDILVAGHIKEIDGSYTVTMRIYRNDAETYVPIEVIDCVPCDGWFDLTAATWADYDADGDMDILVTGTYNSGSQIEGRARVYANNGGVFTETDNDLPAPNSNGTRGGTFTWLDLDEDHDLDYFIAGQYYVPGGNGLVEAQMHAYRNDVEVVNLAPSAPGNMTSAVEGDGTVRLSWTPAGDDRTPAAALTYDLDLYRTHVPLASPRRLPEPGNVSSVTEWVLTDLPAGRYQWVLRAVDSSYNGGAAAQGAFTIGSPADAPGIEEIPSFYDIVSQPNPFHETTSFRFSLPASEHVDLAVYDVDGRLVKNLVNESRPAGVHEVPWKAEGMASGTYFVRFSTSEFTKTQRVLFVK